MRKLISSPFVAALIGGAIVAAVMLLAGVGNTTRKTVVEETSSNPAGASAQASGQLSARAIYQRDAPGVVYVTATVIEQSQSPFQLFPTPARASTRAPAS